MKEPYDDDISTEEIPCTSQSHTRQNDKMPARHGTEVGGNTGPPPEPTATDSSDMVPSLINNKKKWWKKLMFIIGGIIIVISSIEELRNIK